MGRTVIPFDKYGTEIVNQVVDFADVLEPGETISVRGVKAMKFTDHSDVTSSLITNIGGTGTEVTYTVSAGDVGQSYWLDVSATLNNAEVLVQRFRMFVPSP